MTAGDELQAAQRRAGRSTDGADREPLVVLDKVNKHFGDLHVLKDIDLTVHRGEVVVVLGPSGSGKSTLCRTINRLEPIDSGTITLDGQPLPVEGKALARLRSEIGMVFQSFNLFAHKSVLDNVTLGPTKVRGLGKAAAEKRARELLDLVGISEQAAKLPAQLSGGQQQRVAIARALAMEPKVILFDEPTSALDPASAWSRRDAEDLDGKKVCSVEGSTSILTVEEKYGAAPVPFATYSECVQQLLSGSVDAVTTDGAILLGYAAENPDELKVVGDAFSEERYGIGYKHGDTAMCKFLNKTIEGSFDDGSWQEAFDSTLGEAGVEAPEPPTVDPCE